MLKYGEMNNNPANFLKEFSGDSSSTKKRNDVFDVIHIEWILFEQQISIQAVFRNSNGS